MDTKTKGYIISALRRIQRWSKERTKVLGNSKKGRAYVCSKCVGIFPRDDIRVDHIEPVVSTDTLDFSWDNYIERLFVPETGLQVLCLRCHKDKTQLENQKRKKMKEEAAKVT